MAHSHDRSSRRGGAHGADTLARGLGWFSIALGLAEVLAAESLTAALGMEGQAGLVRGYGVREIATGVGILSQDDPTPWIWGRIVGDALDLVSLAAGLTADNPERDRVGLAIGTVAAVTALDVICATALSASRPRPPVRDYSDRRGMPRPPDEMRGLARNDRRAPDLRPA